MSLRHGSHGDRAKDVSWFDLKEVAALPSEINDDLEPLGCYPGDE